MADNPPAQPAGSFRVVRIQGHVTETIVQAASPGAARAKAMTLDPSLWTSRQILQSGEEDMFEYDVCGSDAGVA